jgi:ADP-ribose pyrophosphatase YjhB (NUDIX family)
MERYCIKCGEVVTKKNDSLYMCEAGHENWINPAVGVSAYVIKDGKVLFGVRSRDPGKGKLDVPGGFVEAHESAEQAAIREAKEEFDIDITLTNCFGTYLVSTMAGPHLILFSLLLCQIKLLFLPTT